MMFPTARSLELAIHTGETEERDADYFGPAPS
jgi:hypothetical protein